MKYNRIERRNHNEERGTVRRKKMVLTNIELALLHEQALEIAERDDLFVVNQQQVMSRVVSGKVSKQLGKSIMRSLVERAINRFARRVMMPLEDRNNLLTATHTLMAV